MEGDSVMQKKNKIRLAVLLTAAVLVCLGILGYLKYASPTRIAFVNYPEYVLAEDLDQPINPAIEVSVLPWGPDSGEELRNYDAILFFGMGTNISERQRAILDSLEKPIYLTSTPNNETAKNTMTPEQRKVIADYMRNGGKDNFRNMLNYIRRELDGKRLRVGKIEPVKIVPRTVFFHVDEKAGFMTYKEYLDYYKSIGRYHPESSTVLLYSGNGGGDLGKLIEALEKRKLNVVAINGMRRLTEMIEEAKPDLIIYQPHGRLGSRDPEGAVGILAKYNIPLLCPIKSDQPYDVYLKDQRGMDGGMLSQSVTMPEIDGAVAPFVLSALFRNERGLLAYKAIPDRVERFAELVRKITAMRHKKNAEKKVAIIYYKGHGKNALTAGGIEVGDSLLNLLRHLRKAGFNTGDLPESTEELLRRIQDNAAVFGAYAKGAMQEFMEKAKMEKIPREEYEEWIRKSMPADLYETVTARYGEFPGKTFRTPDGKLALGMLRFGNIVLMPQSISGEGEDTDKVVHGVKMAPPHPYIATYLWIRHKFDADALIHFGTHGSLEFTPWKQVALSSYDWPDVLIGEMPHYYLYMMNDMGEAQIAKRRSYAALISHLTAPFMYADGYGTIRELDRKIEMRALVEDARLKEEYGKSIIELAKKEKFDHELQFSPDFAAGKLNKADLELLHNYLHDLQGEKINRGLYVLGRSYTNAEAEETAKLMTVDMVAYDMFKADVEAGKVDRKKRSDSFFYHNNYLKPAGERIDRAFADVRSGRQLLPSVRIAQEKARKAAAKRKAEAQAKPKASSMVKAGGMPMGGMGGMGMGGRRASGENPLKKFAPELRAVEAYENLLKSTPAELDAFVNALSGGYLYPSPGNDPIGNPEAVPTGRNLYGIDPERTPTPESFAVGKQLAEELIAQKRKSTGKYPKKVSFTVWGGEFINTHGSDIGEIFYLLGVEPVWDARGRVQDVRLIPLSELGRPRIDVVVQTSVQFRGAATSRMRLIDRAVRLAASDPSTDQENYVAEGNVIAAKALIKSGVSPEEAKKLANARIFGGGNGEDNGPGVGQMTQSGDKWEDPAVVAEAFIRNRGTLYTEENWGVNIPGVYRAALQNTDTVVQSRSSSAWGPLSLDHVYEFTGGANLAIRHITGKEPEVYFNDLRTPGQAKVQTGTQAVMSEARTTVLNPKYIKEMMEEGPTGANTFAAYFSNTYGWEVTKPDMIQDYLWEEYKKVYVDDSLKLGVKEYFEKKNPYAYQEMTAIMLETIRKGYWKADEATVKQLAALHAELIKKHTPGCSGFVCNNAKLKDMIADKLSDDPQAAAAYKDAIRQIREAPSRSEKVEGQVLKEQRIDPVPQTRAKTNAIVRQIVIGAIILLAILAVFAGSRRRKQK